MLTTPVYNAGSNDCSKRRENKLDCKSKAEKNENTTVSIIAQRKTIREKLNVCT